MSFSCRKLCSIIAIIFILSFGTTIILRTNNIKRTTEAESTKTTKVAVPTTETVEPSTEAVEEAEQTTEAPQSTIEPTTVRTTRRTTQPPISVLPWVYVYTGRHFEGRSGMIDITRDCKTLPKEWQNIISSINTRGNCVLACERDDCTRCERIAPGTRDHHVLAEIGLENKITSFNACAY